jgi:hypothetical protein
MLSEAKHLWFSPVWFEPENPEIPRFARTDKGYTNYDRFKIRLDRESI